MEGARTLNVIILKVKIDIMLQVILEGTAPSTVLNSNETKVQSHSHPITSISQKTCLNFPLKMEQGSKRWL